MVKTRCPFCNSTNANDKFWAAHLPFYERAGQCHSCMRIWWDNDADMDILTKFKDGDKVLYVAQDSEHSDPAQSYDDPFEDGDILEGEFEGYWTWDGCDSCEDSQTVYVCLRHLIGTKIYSVNMHNIVLVSDNTAKDQARVIQMRVFEDMKRRAMNNARNSNKTLELIEKKLQALKQ